MALAVDTSTTVSGVFRIIMNETARNLFESYFVTFIYQQKSKHHGFLHAEDQ